MVCVNIALHHHAGPFQRKRRVFQRGPCMPVSNDESPEIIGPFDTHMILGDLEKDASFGSGSRPSSISSSPPVRHHSRRKIEDDRCGLAPVFEKLRGLPGLRLCLEKGLGEQVVEGEGSRIHVEAWSVGAGYSMVDSLVDELFSLQDLNDDGLLEEWELIKMNQVISFLHHGSIMNPVDVQERYSRLFRKHLNANGEPVGCAIFRRYFSAALQERDGDQLAQVAIVEQLVAEAQLARVWLQHGLGLPDSGEGL
mmetsp:Transcript_130269/g.259842  ORF Transcript_130269/g.259842 Transcript_130269/m.259842 type:complete len:253 (+) Transcript_130269:81-839(+)